MSTIDKQRIAAVRTLQALGYAFVAGEWKAPTAAVCRLVRAPHMILTRIYSAPAHLSQSVIAFRPPWLRTAACNVRIQAQTP